MNGRDEDGRLNDIENDSRTVEIFGDKISSQKGRDILRIGFININGIPNFNDHSKNDHLFQSIVGLQMDVMGLAEVNRDWSKISTNHGWRSRTRGWWEASKLVISYNRNDCNMTDSQPGGTILCSINKLAHRARESGVDETGLGRWGWTRYRGKRGITTVIISAYRPCKPSSAGMSTAYMQQQRFLDLKKDDRNPREAMLEDLGDQLQVFKDNNDQIILLMDCNEDVGSRPMQEWLREQELTEVISSTHDQSPAPPTYNRGS